MSRVIIAALRTTNAGHYAPATIERLVAGFGPAAVSDLMSRRETFVAVLDGHVVGTASLEGQVVRTVFVAPEHQGRGIGRKLMDAVDGAARGAGVDVLRVPSSITARAFYAGLGFVSIREHRHDEERTIIMERRLA